jgi:hypothetical protein
MDKFVEFRMTSGDATRFLQGEEESTAALAFRSLATFSVPLPFQMNPT